MKTIKLFAKLLIAFILLFLFVEVMSKAYILSTYRDLKYKVEDDKLKITVLASKATNINGYVDGNVTNPTKEELQEIYIGVDCFSRYFNQLETVYVKIEKLKPGETRQVHIPYRCQKVDNIRIYDSTQKPEGYKVEKKTDPTYRFALLLAGMLMLFYL